MKNHSSNVNLRLKRQQVFFRTIQRLDRQISAMQKQDKRLSKYRLITFIVGTVLVFWPSSTVQWMSASGAGLLFVFWVVRHHRLHHRLKRYGIWRTIKKTNLARMQVKWSKIPAATMLSADQHNGLGKDLDLVGDRSLHQLIDISISDQGSRRLAAWLTRTIPDIDTSIHRQHIIGELAALPHFRERLILNFHLVSKEKIDSEKMTKWLNVPFDEKRVKTGLFLSIILLAIVYAGIGLSDLISLPSIWFLFYTLYFVVFVFAIKTLKPILEAAQWLDDELSAFKKVLLFLEQYPLDNHKRLNELLSVFRAAAQKPSKKIRSLKIAAACIGLRNNPVAALLLNALFPWDFLFAIWTLRQRKQLKKDFVKWLDTLSKLEAMNSLANFSYIHPDYCFPLFSKSYTGQSTIFNATSLGHPLIDPKIKVSNDYAIEKIGDITLITGSNMAGKSTFLKTVGINLVLAYCGGPVNASSLTTCFFRMSTCIRVNDSLADGISSFYAEVRGIRKMLNHIEQPHPFPVLYFIDEILRGTNNRERLLGSTALVRALAQNHCTGLISTHDLELTSLSEEDKSISNYHFAETIQNGKMRFFYKLKPGPCPTTNALLIMRAEGLPIPP